jgi:hypothetical protein
VREQPISAGERDWVGVDQFLDEAEGKLTKEELVAFAKENEIRLGETVLGGKSPEVEAPFSRVNAASSAIGEGLGIMDMVDVVSRRSAAELGLPRAEGTPTMRPIFEERAEYGEPTEGRGPEVPEEPAGRAAPTGRARELGRLRERRTPGGDEGRVRRTQTPADLSAGAELLIPLRKKPVRPDTADAAALAPAPLERESATTPDEQTFQPIAPVELARCGDPTTVARPLVYLERKPDVAEAYADIQALLSSGEDAVMAARKAEIEADFARGETIQREAEEWEDPQSMRSYLPVPWRVQDEACARAGRCKRSPASTWPQ